MDAVYIYHMYVCLLANAQWMVNNANHMNVPLTADGPTGLHGVSALLIAMVVNSIDTGIVTVDTRYIRRFCN